MVNLKEIIYEDKDFECYKIGEIGAIKIKKNVFEIVTDLPASSNYIGAMKDLEKDRNIVSIIFFNDNGAFGNKEYSDYLNLIFAHKEINKKWSDLELSNYQKRMREMVILNSIITKITRSEKLIVNALRGEIVTPFFGASLAADIRFASEDTFFLLSHLQMNVHPSGALPYFLPKYIGQAKAAQILFYSDKINVREAMELGLIKEILPVENFEEKCIEKVNEIIAKGENVIRCTKRLLAFNFEDLEKYLSMEECNYARK